MIANDLKRQIYLFPCLQLLLKYAFYGALF